jgi:endonuclease/exonuclease/phosphatase family metal-dependent hydrolase
VRIATYNVEWFNALFDDRDVLLLDGHWSGRHDVRRGDQARALLKVFTAIDADAVMVIEAPDSNGRRSTVRALEGFAAAAGIRARRAITGFLNDSQQELALLYDPDRMTPRHDPGASAKAPRFDRSFHIDLDNDGTPEAVVFSKPPLELAVDAGGRHLRLIGVHIKSKAPHGATTDAEVLRLAIGNRRKQLAQCIWLRHRVADHLAAGDSLIVMGDFNDGPGLDEYEKLFGRSGIDIVMGEAGSVRLTDPHARAVLTAPATAATPVSSRFFIQAEGRWLSALLDYIMVSPDLAARSPRWRIWHPFDDPSCFRDRALSEALLTASDHFPVTLDIDL